ncbi:hypothetical protein TTHERM_001009804 (macronuclear) [Tetrahymena thermophila SB210]|uniref:Kinase domain protein n=1 Tax=Tetrahymena thermophila (strain SB210) TaxID=312017 RepID=W7XBZ9_TETTS|nr:hypothetical protein TTHERM_001009804 [Tetrahymena thermophila SB210]EWS73978.1 hypothetical protein TTHERM_001009804 [Tetrahymena thermophila SB210]|eukprot:XP_012653481.1 hypothetical protein TTHERM_001009804 [Tetrahymena thermophila SB210]
MCIMFRNNKIGSIGILDLGSGLVNCSNLSNLTLNFGQNQINEFEQLKVKGKCLKSKRLVVFKTINKMVKKD